MMTITETQNLIRNTQIGRLKALTRAVVAEAELAEVEKERDDALIALASARKQLELYKALQDKAQAVVDRWDSPMWKSLRHTGTHINELRDTLSALENNK